MARRFKTQLTGQIGESLVVSELGRRGIVATSFSGNVPEIDILAYENGLTTHLQVKAWRSGSVHFDAARFLKISFEGKRQIVTGLIDALDENLIFVFVRIGESAGSDRFFLLTQTSLQAIIEVSYRSWLQTHDGVRPKNPTSTHVAVPLDAIAAFEDNWALVKDRLSP